MASPVVSLTCTFGIAVDSRQSTVDRKFFSTRVRRKERSEKNLSWVHKMYFKNLQQITYNL